MPREALVTDLIEALVQAVRCQEPRSAIATLDSAWHLGLVDEEEIGEVFSRLPRRYRRLRGLLDKRSESGPETLVRLLLRALGCHVDVQPSSWLQQKRDRRRDLAAARLGYTTVRLLAEDVMWSRELVQSALKEIIAHGRSGRSRSVHNS